MLDALARDTLSRHASFKLFPVDFALDIFAEAALKFAPRVLPYTSFSTAVRQFCGGDSVTN